MKVEVTQADIDQAKLLLKEAGADRTECCPVAVALGRLASPAQTFPPAVFSDRVYFNGSEYRHTEEVAEVIRQYDGEDGMTPFAFELGEAVVWPKYRLGLPHTFTGVT